MATRTIVTSQPDVACQVCGRRLLRGEQPDVFIAAGRRLIVCELCAPRAAHEGWLRESESAQLAMPAARPRRGRSFLERLRQVGRPPGAEPPAGRGEAALSSEQDAPHETPRAGGPAIDGDGAAAPMPPPEQDAPAVEPTYPELAVETFNASEYPRRIAGVARSLGAPEVSVRSAEHLDSVVVVVVAWELCWYRYEVDLGDGVHEVRPLEQGTELAQLRRDDRLGNAIAAEDGTLALAAPAI